MRRTFVCLLILGLIFVGCDTETDEDENIINDTDGRLTITGLSGVNGLRVIAFGRIPGESAEFIAIEDFSEDSNDIISGEISDGKVTLKVWIEASKNTAPDSYEGDDKEVRFKVFVINYETVNDDQVMAIRGNATSAALREAEEFEGDFFIMFGEAIADFTEGIGEAGFEAELGISWGG